MSPPNFAERLEHRATAAEEMIAALKTQVQQLQEVVQGRRHSLEMMNLRKENEALRQEVEEWRQRLTEAEVKSGVKQFAVPVQSSSSQLTTAVEVSAVSPAKPDVEMKPLSEKGSKGESRGKGPDRKAGAEVAVDVGRLDFRVGKIVTAQKHPDADSLYVEKVDVGEEKTRTVVSGLVRFMELDELQNRMAVVLCNLKPVNMRGVTSEAMLMCASTPDKVEILMPPTGAAVGDIVEFCGFRRCPDSVLNPKKKIFETCAPDLKTNEEKVATYKGVPFIVPGKGVVVAPSLACVQIK